MAISNSMFPANRNYSSTVGLRASFDKLQLQLSSGERFASLSEVGSARVFDYNIRARVSQLETYSSNIMTTNLRLDFLDNSVSRLEQLESDSRSAVSTSHAGADGLNMITAKSQAEARLDEVLSIVNGDINGRFMFAGDKTDKQPSVSGSVFLNGDGTRDGLRTLVSQRNQADLGADGKGRLLTDANTSLANGVTLSEDGAHVFGLKLTNISTTSANIAVTTPGGVAPQTMSAEVTALPVAGDKVTFSFTLPGGKVSAVSLTAVTGTPLNKGEFQIGADMATTASNIGAVLDTELVRLGDTKLKAASTYAAADNFVNGKGETVMRVDGPTYTNATTLSAASATNTVLWYTGGDAVGSARQSVATRVDNNTVVNYGVQANEEGILDMVRALGAMASSDFPAGNANSRDHYAAIASEQYTRLSEANNSKPGSIEVMALEMGVAKSSADAAASRHITYKAQLETMLAEIEATPMEEVAAQLLNVKTRLEASYQTMSILSQLTLVNYMR